MYRVLEAATNQRRGAVSRGKKPHGGKGGWAGKMRTGMVRRGCADRLSDSTVGSRSLGCGFPVLREARCISHLPEAHILGRSRPSPRARRVSARWERAHWIYLPNLQPLTAGPDCSLEPQFLGPRDAKATHLSNNGT